MLPVLRDTNPMATFGPINRLESLFDRVFGDDSGFATRAWAGVPVAMWEDDNHVGIEAELPGVAEADLEVTVHNGMLFIRGERKPQEGRHYLYNGRAYGRFERVIGLPETVDADRVQARLADGVLQVFCPKSPEARPKRITLQAN